VAHPNATGPDPTLAAQCDARAGPVIEVMSGVRTYWQAGGSPSARHPEIIRKSKVNK